MHRRALLIALAAASIALAAPSAAGAEPAPIPIATPLPPDEPPAGGAPPPAAPAAPVPDVTLSDEHSTTTWAHPVDELPIYTLADPHAHRITHTHLLTEDGFAEIYMVLSSHVDAAGRKWLKIRIPGRPNGREGWVSSEALGNLHVTHWAIVINRARETLTVYDDGRRRYVAPVGVGKPGTPTPPGHFWIRERFKLTNPKNPYFPYALGTSDYSTLSEWPGGGVVGIHGPFGEPGRIPGHPSHGCVRMLDKGIAWVGAHVNLGTPVRII